MECGRWLAFAMGETPARSGWRVAARRAARAWRMSLKRETERERARHASVRTYPNVQIRSPEAPVPSAVVPVDALHAAAATHCVRSATTVCHWRRGQVRSQFGAMHGVHVPALAGSLCRRLKRGGALPADARWPATAPLVTNHPSQAGSARKGLWCGTGSGGGRRWQRRALDPRLVRGVRRQR